MSRGPLSGPSFDLRTLTLILAGFTLGVVVTTIFAYSGGLPGLIPRDSLLDILINEVDSIGDGLNRTNTLLENISRDIDSLGQDIEDRIASSIDQHTNDISSQITVEHTDIRAEIQSAKDVMGSGLSRISSAINSLTGDMEVLRQEVLDRLNLLDSLTQIQSDIESISNQLSTLEDAFNGLEQSINQLLSLQDTLVDTINTLQTIILNSMSEITNTLTDISNMLETVSTDIEGLGELARNIDYKSSIELEIEAIYISNLSNPEIHVYYVSLETSLTGPDPNATITNVYLLAPYNYTVTIEPLNQTGVYRVTITLPQVPPEGTYPVVIEAERTFTLPNGETHTVVERKMTYLSIPSTLFI